MTSRPKLDIKRTRHRGLVPNVLRGHILRVVVQHRVLIATVADTVLRRGRHLALVRVRRVHIPIAVGQKRHAQLVRVIRTAKMPVHLRVKTCRIMQL